MRKKISIVLLITALLTLAASLLPAFSPEVKADALAEVNAEIAECNRLLDELVAERSKLKNELSKLDSSSSGTAKELQLLMSDRDAIEAYIALMDERIERAGIERAAEEGEKLMNEVEIDSACEMYAKVILYTYMHGNTSNFEMLFSAGSFSDFLTFIDSSKYILKYNDRLVADLTDKKNALDQRLKDLDKKIEVLDDYKTEQAQAVEELNKKEAELKALAEQLGMDYDALTQKYSGVNSEITRISNRIAELKKKRQDILDSMSDFLIPLPSGSYYITSNFGYRVDPISGKVGSYHRGVDMAAPRGTSIFASKAGTVTTAGWSDTYGNYVIIYHGNGFSTLYAHASKLLVKYGDVVKRGDVIAQVGTTGYSTGNHLHFSVIIDGEFVNPDKYLPAGYKN